MQSKQTSVSAPNTHTLSQQDSLKLWEFKDDFKVKMRLFANLIL